MVFLLTIAFLELVQRLHLLHDIDGSWANSADTTVTLGLLSPDWDRFRNPTILGANRIKQDPNLLFFQVLG